MNARGVENMTKTDYENDKQIIFRLPETLKIDLRVALMERHLHLQHTLAAFTDVFVAWSKGAKVRDPMKAIIERSRILAENNQ